MEAAPARVRLLLPGRVELEAEPVHAPGRELVAVEGHVLAVVVQLVRDVADGPGNFPRADGLQGIRVVDVVDDLGAEAQEVLPILHLVPHLAHIHEAPGLRDVVPEVCEALRRADGELVAEVRAVRCLL